MNHISLRCVALLFAFLSGHCFAAPVAFPPDSGYVNVPEKYGAKGDGVSDDTAAFAQAAKGLLPNCAAVIRCRHRR